jgi:hypothetical protein
VARDDFRSWHLSSVSVAHHFGSDWRKSGHSWRMLKPTRMTPEWALQAEPVNACHDSQSARLGLRHGSADDGACDALLRFCVG